MMKRTPFWPQRAVHLAAALALGGACGAAVAHDTWFQPQPLSARGELVLALGTGTQFPVQDTPVGLRQLRKTGCRGAGLPATGLRWVADQPTALLLRTALPVPAGSAFSCWAQLVPIDIQIDDATVDLYLAEIKAPPAVRERWSQLKAAGKPWRETYTKHVRIELDADAGVQAAATEAVEGLGLDVRVEGPRPLRAGDTLRAQVLRDGQPLAGLSVELRNDLSPVGIWRQTDEQGRIEVVLPLAANWLLRGVDLRPAADHPDHWDSRFIDLGLQVLPRR
jgi:hypothetical protein